jgi:hypothetical protein
MAMKLLMLSMANDGEMIFQINKYRYRVWLDTAYYSYIRKWMHRKPGMIINFIKRKGEVKRI